MSLTTAVVGGGTVSDRHLDGLAKLAMTDLVAVCDVDEDTVREKAREYDLKAYTDVEAMLAQEDLDWVHLCTPRPDAPRPGDDDRRGGRPRQIEKPVTETVAGPRSQPASPSATTCPSPWSTTTTSTPRCGRPGRPSGGATSDRSARSTCCTPARPGPTRSSAAPGPTNSPAASSRKVPHPIYMLLNLGGIRRAPTTSTPAPSAGASTTASSPTTASSSSSRAGRRAL